MNINEKMNAAKALWNVAGITRDQRSMRIMDNNGNVVAYVPVNPDDPDSVKRTEAIANLVATAPSLQKVAESILRWDERGDICRLPRAIEKRLLGTLARAAGRI